MEIVAADIGGTHARFAMAEIRDGRVARLDPAITLKTADHAGLAMAWEAFGKAIARPLPRAAAIAVACPVAGTRLKLTNNPWIIEPARIEAQLGLDRSILINDFGAVGYAAARLGAEHMRHLCGPDRGFGRDEVIGIAGPGTGLGVAHVVRRSGINHVIEGEGGHIDFAPLDSFEDGLLARLRERHRRVSVERIVAGPGLAEIHRSLAAIEGIAVPDRDDKALWTQALDGSDRLAALALDRFCLSLGSVAGDIALAQGATAFVIAGGVGLRLADHLPHSGFAARFAAKGRFEAMMAAMPVRILTHPQPGLYGAAAAFAQEHRP